MNPPLMSGSRRRLLLVLTAVGALGIPAIFLPFAWDESPWSVITDGAELIGAYKVLAWPFVLCVPVTAAGVLWLAGGSFSRISRAIAFLLSAVVVVLTLSLYFTQEMHLDDVQDWVSYSLPLLSLGLGAAALVRMTKSPNSAARSYAPILAMQAAYLPSCLLCLSSFVQDLQPGGYCALAVSAAFIVQIVMVLRLPAQEAGPQPD
jgi:hypothetical protein